MRALPFSILLVSLLVVFALTGFSARPARAQELDCEAPLLRGPVASTPADGGRGVTLGAPVRIRYSEGYFEDPSIGADPQTSIQVFEGEGDVPYPGSIHVTGDVLVFTPEVPYLPNENYRAVAAGLDRELTPSFRTGSDFDRMAPELGEITGMTAESVGPTCDLPDGGYRIDVSFGPAMDDGALGDIEYLLFLTRGVDVEAPELKARARNFPSEEIILAFPLSDEQASSPICVSVQALDGVGNIDDDGTPFCDDPIKGNFFEPLCSVGAVGGPARAWPFGLSALLGLLLIRRRR